MFGIRNEFNFLSLWCIVVRFGIYFGLNYTVKVK